MEAQGAAAESCLACASSKRGVSRGQKQPTWHIMVHIGLGFSHVAWHEPHVVYTCPRIMLHNAIGLNTMVTQGMVTGGVVTKRMVTKGTSRTWCTPAPHNVAHRHQFEEHFQCVMVTPPLATHP